MGNQLVFFGLMGLSFCILLFTIYLLTTQKNHLLNKVIDYEFTITELEQTIQKLENGKNN